MLYIRLQVLNLQMQSNMKYILYITNAKVKTLKFQTGHSTILPA
jgi:hypothetical protein